MDEESYDGGMRAILAHLPNQDQKLLFGNISLKKNADYTSKLLSAALMAYYV